jgi:hypothetical protein
MTLTLPERRGPRPATFDGIPHRQLDQTPPLEVYDRLVERFLRTSETSHGPSLISVPGAVGLFLECDGAKECSAFLRGTEFAHVHPASDGSFHMVLSQRDSDHVIARGWGEQHPWARSGRIQPTVLLIYAPRDEQEIDVVLTIVGASKANAKAVLAEGGASSGHSGSPRPGAH